MMGEARTRYPRIVSIVKAQQVVERAAATRLQRRIGPFDGVLVLHVRPPVARDAAKVVDLIDGKLTVDELLNRASVARLRALEILDDLVRRGAVEVRVPETKRDVFTERGSDPEVERVPSRARPLPASLASPSSPRKGPIVPRRDTPEPMAARSGVASRRVELLDRDEPPAVPSRMRPTPFDRPAQRAFDDLPQRSARPITLPFEDDTVLRSAPVTLPYGDERPSRRLVPIPVDEDANARVTLNDPDEVAAHVSLLRNAPPSERGVPPKTFSDFGDLGISSREKTTDVPPPPDDEYDEEEEAGDRSDPPPAMSSIDLDFGPPVGGSKRKSTPRREPRAWGEDGRSSVGGDPPRRQRAIARERRR